MSPGHEPAPAPLPDSVLGLQAGYDDVLALPATGRPEVAAALAVLADRARAAADRELAAVAAANALATEGRRSVAGWLAEQRGTSVPLAGEDVRRGLWLARLPRLAEVFASGEVTVAHVDAARRALTRLGDAERVELDGRVADVLLATDPTTAWRALTELVEAVHPRLADADARAAAAARSVTLDALLDGRWHLSGWLDPTLGGLLSSVLTAQIDAERRADGDQRTMPQRRHDALESVVRAGVAAEATPAGRAGLGHLIVTVPVDTLAADPLTAEPAASAGDRAAAAAPPRGWPWGRAARVAGGPLIDSTSVSRLSCDATLTRVLLDSRSGRPLDVGRSSRTVSEAQWIALLAVQGGCQGLGCHAEPGACEAHHVIWWSKGGRTDLDNLLLLCPREHLTIHAGGTITLHNGRRVGPDGYASDPPPDTPAGRRRARYRTRHHLLTGNGLWEPEPRLADPVDPPPHLRPHLDDADPWATPGTGPHVDDPGPPDWLEAVDWQRLEREQLQYLGEPLPAPT